VLGRRKAHTATGGIAPAPTDWSRRVASGHQRSSTNMRVTVGGVWEHPRDGNSSPSTLNRVSPWPKLPMPLPLVWLPLHPLTFVPTPKFTCYGELGYRAFGIRDSGDAPPCRAAATHPPPLWMVGTLWNTQLEGNSSNQTVEYPFAMISEDNWSGDDRLRLDIVKTFHVEKPGSSISDRARGVRNRLQRGMALIWAVGS
jgi:hypothetical protein